MGMSASQVRFLSLQHRKHNIGRELTTLSNRKMGLSRDMNRVSKNYTEALNRTKLQWSNNSGNTYSDLSYDLLMKPNDINCEVPYILTDAQGRVVVDNTKFWFDKEAGEMKYGSDVPAGKGVSYRELAAAISSYSGIDTYNNNQTTFLNKDRLGVNSHTIGDIDVPHDPATFQMTSIDAKGSVFGLPSAEGCEYEVVSGIQNYDFRNTLRYELMQQLGILSEADVTRYNEILDELYGSQNGVEVEGGYDTLLKKYDADHFFEFNGSGDTYDTFFGELVNGSGVLELNGGCAAGNLALAKAYQREYQAFLNTEITHNVNTNRKDVIVEKSTAANIKEMDAKNTHVVAEYEFSDSKKSGISNRIVGLLTLSSGAEKVTSSSSGGGTKYEMDVNGILNNLKFYSMDGEATYGSFRDAFAGGTGDYNVYANHRGADPTWGWNEDVWYSNSGLQGHHNLSTISNWGQLYSPDGSEFDDGKKVSITGYTWGENRPYGDDLIQIWDALEVSNNLHLSWNDGYHTHDDGSGNASLGGWFEMLKYSFLNGVPGVNADAVEYAYDRMCSLYQDGIADNTEHSNGDHSGYVTRERAASESNNNFGVGWCNEFGSSDDGCAISSTNAIAAFVTFYEMYMTAERDPNLFINDGSTDAKVYKPEVNRAFSLYDMSYAKDVNNDKDIVGSGFEKWKKSNDDKKTAEGISDYVYTAPTTTGNGEHIFKYTYKSTHTKEDGTSEVLNYTQTAKVTGNWNGSSFSSISNIEVTSSITGGSDGPTNQKYIINKASDGTYTYKDYLNDGSTIHSQVTYKKGSSGVAIHISDIHSSTAGQYGSITSMDLNYKSSGRTSIEKINGSDPSSDAFMTNGKVYAVVTHDAAGASTLDADYVDKFYITPQGVNTCAITTTITAKPEDTFSQQIDDMVDYWEDKVERLKEELETAFGGFESKFMDYFDVIFKRISQNGWVYDEKVNSSSSPKASQKYMNTMLENNKYYITEARELSGDAKYQYTMKIAQNVQKVYEVHDTNAENQAFAEYESAKTLISMKEKKIDARMAKLETEQQAITTELDSLEKVRNDNIDKYFKIFA